MKLFRAFGRAETTQEEFGVNKNIREKDRHGSSGIQTVAVIGGLAYLRSECHGLTYWEGLFLR